jgi:hypothetical protein
VVLGFNIASNKGWCYCLVMKTSRWVKYDRKSRLWIQSNKVIYFYWYSFLQHAERDPSRSVDWTKYDGWGGSETVLNTKFDGWWRSHWKDLFGIPNEGDEPKFPLSTKRPKEQGLRYALLVYEKREIGDLWKIANEIARREWDRRKKGLTSTAFDYAVLEDWNNKPPKEKSRRKRYTHSKVARIRDRGEELLDGVCKGIFP